MRTHNGHNNTPKLKQLEIMRRWCFDFFYYMQIFKVRWIYEENYYVSNGLNENFLNLI